MGSSNILKDFAYNVLQDFSLHTHHLMLPHTHFNMHCNRLLPSPHLKKKMQIFTFIRNSEREAAFNIQK